MATTYDPKCYDLAVHFLEDKMEPVPILLIDQLARKIQQTIEEFLDDDAAKTD